MSDEQLTEGTTAAVDPDEPDEPRHGGPYTLVELTSYGYMKMMRRSLRYMGAWPYRIFGERVPTHLIPRHYYVLVVLWGTMLTLQLIYIWTNYSDLTFFEMGHSYITMFMNVVAFQRITMSGTKSYPRAMAKFLGEIHLMHHKHKSEHAMQIHQRVRQLCTVFCKLLHCQLILTWIAFNLFPFVNNFRAGMFSGSRPANVTFESAVYYYFPFDYHYNVYGYITVFFLNLYVAFDCGFSFSLWDLNLSLVVFHIWGYIRILDYNLRNFPKPTTNTENLSRQLGFEVVPRYTEAETRDVKNKLKEIIEQHLQLSQFVDQISEAFGPMLAVYLLFHQVCLCILLLECSTMDPKALFLYGILTLTLIEQMVQISIVFELIGTKAAVLVDAVYASPWELMEPSEQKMVLLLLLRTQKPVHIKAMGLVGVGVQTMASILRTSISYFVMLRALAP